jgi:hypothetical protein
MTEKASPRDLAHFAAVGRAEVETEEERFAEAATTPAGERMLTGLKLGSRIPLTPAVLAEMDACADGQMELARRRVALGISWKRK